MVLYYVTVKIVYVATLSVLSCWLPIVLIHC